jgi:hypothetical protein
MNYSDRAVGASLGISSGPEMQPIRAAEATEPEVFGGEKSDFGGRGRVSEVFFFFFFGGARSGLNVGSEKNAQLLRERRSSTLNAYQLPWGNVLPCAVRSDLCNRRNQLHPLQ